MLKSFEVTGTLPSRGSATALRQQLLDHLLKIKPAVGERFLSDHELSRISRLSRPTVRRALDDLEREGWIERRPGIGTFIGPRAGLGFAFGANLDLKRSTVRLALMIHMLGDFGHDWYASGLMSGIDRGAEETGVSLELLGNQDGDVKSVSRRLMQSRPDVLAFAAPPLRHTLLIGEARRLEIPCIGTGTLMASIGVPAVCEDGHDAARRAVKHLFDQGHRRIGMALGSFALPWIFHRRQGYVDGLAEVGLDPDESMVLWLDGDDAGQFNSLQRYLDDRQPTAMIFASWVLTAALATLVRSGRISIPRDLSVITFDQHPSLADWFGVAPTTMAIPLAQMGRHLAHMARDLATGKPVNDLTTLKCELVVGESVANVSGKTMTMAAI